MCSAFGSLLDDLGAGKVDLKEWWDVLGVVAALYLVETQSYTAALAQGAPVHQALVFAQIPRSKPVGPEGAPTGFNDESSTLLTSADLETMVQDILRVDRTNHPERFGSAAIHPFKGNPSYGGETLRNPVQGTQPSGAAGHGNCRTIS